MVSDDKKTLGMGSPLKSVEETKKSFPFYGVPVDEAIICKSSQFYRLCNDMDVFGVRFFFGQVGTVENELWGLRMPPFI